MDGNILRNFFAARPDIKKGKFAKKVGRTTEMLRLYMNGSDIPKEVADRIDRVMLSDYQYDYKESKVK